MKIKPKFKIWHLLAVTLMVAGLLWCLRLGDNFDRDLAENATLVIRARLVQSHGGSKCHWNTVEVRRTFKNETEEKIPDTIEVAHYGWNPGIPDGESTLYLVRYNDQNPESVWKLVEPMLNTGARHGVSHHAACEGKKGTQLIELI